MHSIKKQLFSTLVTNKNVNSDHTFISKYTQQNTGYLLKNM